MLTRDWTKLRFSVARRSPPVNVQRGLPNSSCTINARTITVAVPKAADDTRQPNASVPKASSPRAMAHFPRGGWTHAPVSFLSLLQNRSSLLVVSQRALE